MDKLTGNKVTSTLAMMTTAVAILLIFVGLPGTTMISAQTSANATNAANTIATGGRGTITNLPPTGGTSTSSVEGATASERSGS